MTPIKEGYVRKSKLHERLKHSEGPITGQDLASELGVTRQVVVHDIAILRAEGIDIISTPRGYVIASPSATARREVLAVSHAPELTPVELYTFVDFGIHVVDVQVEHAVYGELKGSLHLSSRRDVDLFLEQVNSTGATLLSSLTDGHHLHTIETPDEKRLQEAVSALRRQGIQVFD